GWDPVENSSLIPWLTSLALLHTLLIQRKSGGLYKTNIFLALLTFLLVLWGSFLTRSGVLSDFSVHSFSESDLNSYLVAFVLLFTGMSAFAFIVRAGGIRSARVSAHLLTRESFMLLGVLALILSAIFTFFGTSAPLFTGLFAEKAASVAVEYYNLLNAPLALLFGIFIAIAPVMRWKRESGEKIREMGWYFLGSLLISTGAFFLGLDDLFPLAIFAVFVLVVLVNGHLVYQYLNKGNMGFGGYLAHVGIGCMMIGIITSSVYEKIEKTSLPLDVPKTVLGYEMTYRGFILSDDGKDAAVIRVTKGGSELYEAYPKFYWSKSNQSYMRNPDVQNLWLKDLYIAPIQVIPVEDSEPGKKVTLVVGSPVEFETMTLEFKGYEMSAHQTEADNIFVQAVIEVASPSKRFVLKPAIQIEKDRRAVLADTLPATNRIVRIDAINVDEKALVLYIGDENEADSEKDKGPGEMLAVEVTEKPLINLLWFGTFLMIAGFTLALYNRFRPSTGQE
ncbi:MAG: hypothetical protein E4H13_11260, partial [Calditrichales bacterium]